MTGLAEYNFKLHQLYPGRGGHHLNTCANPDCHNFGVAPEAKAERRSRYQTARSDLTKEQLRTIAEHGPGAYKLAGADKSHRRVSQAFHHANAPYQWHDQRTVRCKAMLSNGTICNSGFSILSGDHLNEEIERLRNHNGVLDGPACGAWRMNETDRISEVAGQADVAFDALGGTVASRVLCLMREGASFVGYGLLTGQPVIPAGKPRASYKRFHMRDHLAMVARQGMSDAFAGIWPLLTEMPAREARVHPASDWRAAIAGMGGPGGPKPLLDFSSLI